LASSSSNALLGRKLVGSIAGIGSFRRQRRRLLTRVSNLGIAILGSAMGSEQMADVRQVRAG
jgi:hypothetical protein